MAGKKRGSSIQVVARVLVVLVLFAALAITLYRAEQASREESQQPDGAATAGELAVHVIDVGQGDAILLRTPAQDILIDGGERGSDVLDYLSAEGVGALDLVICTHPHSDHVRGLVEVIEQLPVGEVIDAAVPHTSQVYEKFLTAIDEKEIKYSEGRAGMSRDLGGGAVLAVLYPVSPSADDLNNASVVVRIDFGQVSFIFSGDAETKAENEMLESGVNLRGTVLKVGHHGSNSSTSPEFLDAVRPEAAVISAGEGNSYGHPHAETLEALAAAGVKVFRTDLQGTIVITTDGITYITNVEPCAFMPPPLKYARQVERPAA